MEDPAPRDESPRFLKVLEALKQASHHLHSNPTSTPVEALLDLDTVSDDPSLANLSHHLSDLKSLMDTLQKARGRSLGSFLTRRVSAHSISRVAGSIESEIQAWIDRENVETLAKALTREQTTEKNAGEDVLDEEDELVLLLTQFAGRVSQGFNRELQDLVLRSKILSLLESVLSETSQPTRVREKAAFCIAALIGFNKDVFVGEVSMDLTIHALVEMSTTSSIKVLCLLIKSIKSAFVDGIVSNGEIPKIIGFLGVKETEMQVIAFDCVLEIGYFGRKEAIEAMLEGGLVQKLVEMQRSELGGDLIEIAVSDDKEGNDSNYKNQKREETGKFLEKHPLASCVVRFAVQLEVGEGLRQREKRAFKQEILAKVREASVCDAEAATIIAEVLWGSSPLS